MQVPSWSITAQHIRSSGLLDASESAAEQLEKDYILPSENTLVKRTYFLLHTPACVFSLQHIWLQSDHELSPVLREGTAKTVDGALSSN